MQAAAWLQAMLNACDCNVVTHALLPCCCSPAPQFHRTRDYPVTRPTLFLRQFLHAATRLVVTVGADPMTEEEAFDATEEELEAAAQR